MDDLETTIIEGTIRHQTAAAVLVDVGGDEPVWIPKSQILEMEETPGGLFEFEIPEWVAIKKGLV